LTCIAKLNIASIKPPLKFYNLGSSCRTHHYSSIMLDIFISKGKDAVYMLDIIVALATP